MSRILICYSTTDGHTGTICARLKEFLLGEGHAVDVSNIADDPDLDLAPYDKVVVGASIRYGKHNPRAYKFIAANQQELERRPNAFFSVNVVARKAEKNQPETNPYMQKFLGQIAWQPKHLAVFAGRIDYPRYGFVDKQMIRLIMWMTKGPTDPTSVNEFTDWDKVDEFGQVIAGM